MINVSFLETVQNYELMILRIYSNYFTAFLLEMMKHIRTIQERNATFFLGGTVSVNDCDLDLHFEVRV